MPASPMEAAGRLTTRKRPSIGRLLFRSLLVSGLAIGGSGSIARAQSSPELQQVLERLDRLEAQNRELLAEVHALQQQVAVAKQSPQPAAPEPTAPTAQADNGQAQPEATQSVQDRLTVQDHRIAQLDQEKVSSDHRLPVTLTGMLLMNTFYTGRGAGADNPTIAPPPNSPAPLPASGGATFRQTVLGLKFEGPEILGGAKVSGSAYMDFFGGPGTALNQYMRLRVATVDADWKNTTLAFALDKPIIAPREPDSLAQVGVSPLTSAGNLWLWQPQVRVEQRFGFGPDAGLRAQLGIYETSEGGTGLSNEYGNTLSKSRPGYQGRFEFWKQQGETRRIEIAPGFHISDTHVVGQSVPSRIFSVDWLIRPVQWFDLTGTFFHGENTGVVGGLRQGVSIINGVPIAVGATGGWAQLKFRLTQRATLNFFGGQEDDRNRDLEPGGIAKNQTYAGNIMYRFGSNILASFETSRVRTTYLNSGTRTFPHYDLGLAYLF